MADSRSDSVLPLLSLAAILSVLLLDYGSVQANRIVAGVGHSLWSALGSGLATLLLLSLLAILVLNSLPNLSLLTKLKLARLKPHRYSKLYSYTLLLFLLLQMPFGLAWFAAIQIPESQPFARAAPGAGFWLLLFFSFLMLLELQRSTAHRHWLGLGIGLSTLAAWWLCLQLGWLDSLALVREYRSQQGPFKQALQSHLLLVGGTLLLSALLGGLLTALILNFRSLQSSVFALLNFLQTIPSIALFSLLIAPLSALSMQFPWLQSLGIRGIGWAPALIALVAYSLLPMVRNCTVALQQVSAEVLQSAQAMGMNRVQLFFQVRLPLALPVMIEGLRITCIQAIGLTAVAALIGTGGFGNFIFQGLGQAAMDLILLGALPIIALAMVADYLFSAAAKYWQPGVSHD